ncbi:MAG TPA: transposase [Jatrophihabitans sp.]|nr:transposase [Jatrophihabitans sp.]
MTRLALPVRSTGEPSFADLAGPPARGPEKQLRALEPFRPEGLAPARDSLFEVFDSPARDSLLEVFDSLPRRDQRQAAVAYVEGLLRGGTGKSVRAMAMTSQCSSQALQHFVGQSRWATEPVLRQVAELHAAHREVTSWVVADVHFPKTGTQSVCVERQYVAAAERTMNCQLATTVSLAGPAGASPVAWKLRTPRAWDSDEQRRRRAGLPDEHRSRPRHAEIVELVDRLSLEWGLPPTPVVADLRDGTDAEELASALELRGLHYLLAVDPQQRLPIRVSGRSQIRQSEVTTVAALRIAQATSDLPRTTHVLPQPAPRSRSQYFRCSLAATPGHSRRHLAVDWPLSRTEPAQLWLTNLPGMADGLEPLIARLADQLRAAYALRELDAHCGLRAYEGRSYAGWHHHVTLASVAHLHRQLGTERYRSGSHCA